MISSTQLSFPEHGKLLEPKLLFHPYRLDDTDIHPLNGLLKYGPFGRKIIPGLPDPIRIATISPFGESHLMGRLVSELENAYQPQERRQYLVDFPGFSRVFGLKAVLAERRAHIELSSSMDEEIRTSAQAHLIVSERIARAFSNLLAFRNDFDVVFIYLPMRWEPAFFGSKEDNFDLHDFIKAMTAVQGVPSQVVREDSALSYRCRCSVMWRLGIALYCKAGGIPWKLADFEAGTAYIGLSYALRKSDGSASPTFITCCSQVFDSDGAGLDFLAYETSDLTQVERENPFLSRSDMRGVMARGLALYSKRHAGQIPRRVVVHKSTEFKASEVDGCFDALKATEGIDLLQIQQSHSWKGVLIDPPRDAKSSKGSPANYPIHRGSYLQLSGTETLLWTQGDTPMGGKSYFQGGKGIPSPLLLRRFAGHGSWDVSCNAILGLSKMNWNNDGLYDALPVTLGYAQVLATTVKRIKDFGSKIHQFKFFM